MEGTLFIAGIRFPKKVNYAKVIGGLIAKDEGRGFEDSFVRNAERDGWFIEKLPDMGAKRVHRNQIITQKMPCDGYAIKDGKCLFFDCKSINQDSLQRSLFMKREHQLNALYSAEKAGALAGYVIFFRTKGEIHFVKASEVKKLNPGESIREGILLGDILNHSLDKILLTQNHP